jgi:malate permease and related proteins
MNNFVLIALCLLLGIVFQRVKEFPSNAHITLNTFIIYVSLPSLTFIYIPQIEFSMKVLIPVFTPYMVFLFACLFFILIRKVFNLNKETVGCLILTAGLGNTSFIGYPVIKALYGGEGLKTAILVDQPGSFVVLSTLGVGVAAYFSSGSPSFIVISKKIFTFPPFICFGLAVLLRIFGFQHNENTLEILHTLGRTVTPLALISVGLQLQFKLKDVSLKELGIGLSYKLIFAPLLIFFLYVLIIGARGKDVQISILQAAMAPMITASIISINSNLRPGLATAMVGIGIPFSFVTLLIWYFLINGI